MKFPAFLTKNLCVVAILAFSIIVIVSSLGKVYNFSTDTFLTKEQETANMIRRRNGSSCKNCTAHTDCDGKELCYGYRAPITGYFKGSKGECRVLKSSCAI